MRPKENPEPLTRSPPHILKHRAAHAQPALQRHCTQQHVALPTPDSRRHRSARGAGHAHASHGVLVEEQQPRPQDATPRAYRSSAVGDARAPLLTARGTPWEFRDGDTRAHPPQSPCPRGSGWGYSSLEPGAPSSPTPLRHPRRGGEPAGPADRRVGGFSLPRRIRPALSFKQVWCATCLATGVTRDLPSASS